MKRSVVFIFLLFSLSFSLHAQPDLPAISVVTQGGISVLSWNNPYESGLKSIAVQRSADSNYNFVTLGYVANLKKGVQSFVDAHPAVGKNWYRLIILFSSDMEWKSSLGKVIVDSSAIANRKPLPPSDSLQKLISQSGNTAAMNNLNTVSYPKSQYVFTNPFTGNINIEIQDALKENYSLIFYDQQDRVVLKVPRINDKIVILDKRNFQATGLFKFKLLKNKEEFDKGYVTIY
ncbi:hypothetical protein [Taibaiella koreensis]|uniref:hypothetical protein n=1 Tax=Taibaiella koreensis TaxID=1268548 RepID=UPI000E59E753|nr:hypothetical protein [Taibaiella koreensis]